MIKNKISKSIFREYDIRGIINETLFEDTAYLIGRGFCSLNKNLSNIVVCRDGRLSSLSIVNSLIKGIKKSGVNAHLITDESRPTTIKQKFRSKGKSLLRVNHLHQDAINSSLQDKISKIIESVIQDVDLLVFSDFNYGCLPQLLVDELIKLANANDVMLAADSQSSSQIGDISRFRGVNLITPTEREARISSRNHEDGLVVLVQQLKKLSSTDNIFLKMGEEGMLIYSGDTNVNEILTDSISALNTSPRDVAGAGDSLLISGALTMTAGGSIWEAALIGSLAAAIQVGRVGNTPLKSKELLKELT